MNQPSAGLSVGEDVHMIIKLLVALLGLPLLLIGVAGNGFLLLVICRQRALQNCHLVFIANLALVDIVIVVIGLPFLVVDLVLEHQLVSSSAHCQVNGFVLYVSGVVSTQSLVFISLSRYMSVCHNRKFRQVFSFNKNIFMCGLTWLLSLTLSFPSLAGGSSYGYDARLHICSVSTTQAPPSSHVVALSLMVLPTVWVYFLNFKIFGFWSASKQRVVRQVWRQNVRTPRRETQPASGSTGARTKSRYPSLDADDIPLSIVNAMATHRSRRRAARSHWLPEEVDGVAATSRVEKRARNVSPFDDHTSARRDRSPWNRLARAGGIRVSQLRQSRKRRRRLQRCQRSSRNVFEDLGHDGASRTRAACCSASSPVTRRDSCGQDSSTDSPTLNPVEDLLVKSLVLSLHPDFVEDFWDSTSLPDTSPAVPLPSRPADTTNPDDELRTTPTTTPASTTKPSTTAATTLTKRVLITSCEKRLINILLAVTASLLVLHTPFPVCGLLDFFVHVPSDVKVFAALLLFVNSSINWIIYGVMNRCLNKPLKDAVKSCCFFLKD